MWAAVGGDAVGGDPVTGRRWRVYRSTVYADTWVATDGYLNLDLFTTHAAAITHADRMARTGSRPVRAAA